MKRGDATRAARIEGEVWLMGETGSRKSGAGAVAWPISGHHNTRFDQTTRRAGGRLVRGSIGLSHVLSAPERRAETTTMIERNN